MCKLLSAIQFNMLLSVLTKLIKPISIELEGVRALIDRGH